MKTAKIILLHAVLAVAAGAQTRTSQINIVNTPDQPVWHAKAIKRQPFQFSTNLSVGLNPVDTTKFFVPSGKRLVLERVTLEGHCGGSTNPMVTLMVTLKGSLVQHPMDVAVSGDSYLKVWTVFAETLGQAVADPNTAVYVQADGSNSIPTNSVVTFTGYLIEAN